MEHIMNDSFEHLSPLMDLWEDKHLYTELNSPSGELFDFDYSANSFSALDIATCVDDADGNVYDQFSKQMVQPSDVYNSNIPIPCIHDINDSDEFWKEIVNVDHNILEDKSSNDCCNSFTDILSCTPLAETNDLYLKPSQKAVDSPFSMDITKTENMDGQEGYVNSCCLDSNETIQENKFSYVCFDYTGCEMGEEVDTNFRRNKTDASFLPLSSPELNYLTFETEDNHFTNTEMKQTSQTYFLPKTANCHFLMDKIDSNKEMTLPQLNASVLNCTNLIGGPKLELDFYGKIQNIVSDTTGSIIPKNDCKLMDFTKTIPQKKSFISLQSCPDPTFLSVNTDSNCYNQILDPKFEIEDKMNAVFADPGSSKTDNASCDKRKPNKVSKCRSLSSIKIDKKGSFLSLPTNSLSTLMVKDLLQMSGSKNERSIKELTMEYRANVVKMMQQKQLRLKRMETLS